MRIQYYIEVQEYNPHDCIYGAMEIINGKETDCLIGINHGNKKEVSENITKMILQRNINNGKYNYRSFLFKYNDINITKEMNWKFNNEKNYLRYSNRNKTELTSSPSVFLSDLKTIEPLKLKMRNYKAMRDYIKSNYNSK